MVKFNIYCSLLITLQIKNVTISFKEIISVTVCTSYFHFKKECICFCVTEKAQKIADVFMIETTVNEIN